MKSLLVRLWKEEEGQDLDRNTHCSSFCLLLAAIRSNSWQLQLATAINAATNLTTNAETEGCVGSPVARQPMVPNCWGWYEANLRTALAGRARPDHNMLEHRFDRCVQFSISLATFDKILCGKKSNGCVRMPRHAVDYDTIYDATAMK